MRRSGVTLIEALVAIALVATVLPVALAAVGDGARTGERARRAVVAQRVAEARLARLLADGSWATAASAGECDPALDGEDAAGLRWQLAVEAWRDPALSRVAVTVAWGAATATVATLARPEASP